MEVNEISTTITMLPKEDFEAPKFSEEIIIEILLRLPVKSLLKFRCVSKLWLSLISSCEFANAHVKFSTKNNIYAHDKLLFGSKHFPMDLYTCSLHSAFVHEGYIYPVVDENLLADRVCFDYPLYESNHWIWLVGSCNGLVCVSTSDSHLILWNPITRKSKVLPHSGTKLIYDYCGITYGFGLDELHDDYKVVEFFSFFNANMSELQIQVKVYSLRSNSWKTLSNWPGGDPFGGSAKFLNGAFHWSITYIDEWEWGIISHDLSMDTFAYLPMPDIEDIDDANMEIKILGGCISACCEYGTYMDVWVMKEYGVKSSWTKIIRIPFNVNLEDNEFVRPRPLFMMPDGKILINYASNLRVYDPENPHLQLFGKSSRVEAITYFESLLSPNEICTVPPENFLAPDFPEEIIYEILLRLPVKSLLKCKRVSKFWCFLISSYQFANAHLKFSTNNNIYAHDRLLFGSKGFPMDLSTCSLRSAFEDTASPRFIYPVIDGNLLVDRVWLNYPLYEPNDVIWLVGSCNGLVCVSLSATTLLLWNPVTGKSKVLPSSGTELNFDYCGITYGFGFDELHDDYKVVEFFSFDAHRGELEIQVKVYSLRTNSWKTLLNWPGGDTFGGAAMFLNGAFHWSVTYIDEGGCDIISHDLSMDTFAYLPMPDIGDDDVRVEIKILGGCLSACCEYGTYMDVWVMKEYGVKSSWTKVVRVLFYLDLDEHGFVRPSPLFMMPDGKMLINYASNLRIYDPENLHIHLFGSSSSVEAITYSESLVSPNLDDY